MAEEFNRKDWGATQYRIDANNNLEKIQRDIDTVNREINVLADVALQSKSSLRASLFSENTRKMADTIEGIQNGGSAAGFRGNSLFGKDVLREAEEAAKQIVDKLKEKEDLLASRKEHDRLVTNALRAERARGKERDEAIRSLEEERAYCEANRKTRELRHGRREEQEPEKAADDRGRSKADDFERSRF